MNEDTKEWNGVLGQFINTPLADISQAVLDTAAKKVYPNVKPQTLDRQFYTPFVAVWNHGAVEGMCHEKKWRRPVVTKADKKRRPWFRKPETAAAIFDELPVHLRALFMFMIYTGSRVTEAIELQIENVFLDEQWAVLNATKTDALRGVPLRADVVEVLRWYIGDRKTGPVFLNDDWKPYKSGRAADGTVKDSGYFKSGFKGARNRAKLANEGYTPYSLRHTFNNWLIRAGVDRETREALMGGG